MSIHKIYFIRILQQMYEYYICNEKLVLRIFVLSILSKKSNWNTLHKIEAISRITNDLSRMMYVIF